MRDNKLISMTDYVLEQDKKTVKFMNDHDGKSSAFSNSFNYAKFIKRTNELGMFVACDLEGNVLEKPKVSDWGNGANSMRYQQALKQYKEALERVIFEGVKWTDGFIYFGDLDKSFCKVAKVDENIEWLIDLIEDLVEHNITLNENGVKLINK